MNTSSPLLCLPRELRDDIIKYVFDAFDQERLRFSKHHNVSERIITPPLRSLPPICAVSRQLYAEATPYFLTRITLVSSNVATSCWLRRWLASFPTNLGYRSIRHLFFRNFHGPEQIRGYDLIALCPNLRSLNIMFGDEYSDPGTVPSLATTSLSSVVNAYECFDNILLMHQLHRLIEIPNLETLEFGFHNWEQPFSSNRARQVKEWLTVKFQAKGKSTHIICKQMQWGSTHSADNVDEVFSRWYSRS
jgi:hypothetical protein